MKLYTEEQVREMLEDMAYISLKGIDDYMSEIASIELPSEEEIEKNNPYEYLVGSKYYSPQNLKYWEEGAKWVIEQIKQQENGN